VRLVGWAELLFKCVRVGIVPIGMDSYGLRCGGVDADRNQRSVEISWARLRSLAVKLVSMKLVLTNYFIIYIELLKNILEVMFEGKPMANCK
jgi:hypothetical protein